MNTRQRRRKIRKFAIQFRRSLISALALMSVAGVRVRTGQPRTPTPTQRN